MAFRVQIASPAEHDLDRALGYISEVLAAPRAAASLLNEYEHVISLLANNPSLFGVDFEVSEAVGMQIRHCMVKGYEVYYHVDDAHKIVFVVAFLHGSRDAAPLISRRF